MNQEALPTFIAEARELSDLMQTQLLALESGDGASGSIDALFRAVHTIKGSAGLFGLDAVVEFAHSVESLLAQLRDGRLALSMPLIALLLECHDHLEHLLAAASDVQSDPAADQRTSQQLRRRLQEFSGVGDAGSKAAPVVSERVAALALPHVDECACSDCWHISVRFMPETLRSGTDPLAVLGYLRTFGHISAIAMLDDALPSPEEFDAENCYLGFECRFETQADRARIESAFEFVRDSSIVTILPPRTQIANYIRLIQELPESEARLGEILVRCGSLTQRELDVALEAQRRMAHSAAPVPLGTILVEQQKVEPAVIDAAVAKQRAAVEGRAREQRSLRVDTDKLEALLDLVSELVVEGAQNCHLSQRMRNAELNESAGRLGRLLEQLREQALKLRMVPIGSIFARFARLVRDDARELGKQVVLHTQGAETELDKTLVERITDPLTHLVRNAIDHGIETSAERTAKGKSAQGTLRLHAYHDSGTVVIEVSDDGGGLDRDKILHKAIERGLAAPGQELSDAQIFEMIFAPGFSTATTVTNLSGRGVGMDVVRRNVVQLRGSIDIASQPNAGTTVTIRLPLTLAIIDGFLVRAGASAFVIPLDMVEECLELKETDFSGARHRFIDLRGEALPFVALREHFNLGAARTATHRARRQSIVVVRCGRQRAGIVVDELLGERQAVVKPLAQIFKQVGGLSGTTILADGAIALIVDVGGLLARCSSTPELHAA